MTRINELEKKYPTTPRDMFIKYEVWDKGLRYTRDLDKVSEWTGPSGSYQTKFDNQNLQQQAADQPHRVKPGFFLRPMPIFMMKSTLGCPVNLKATSPYTIREIAEGRFAVFEGEEMIEEVYFPKPKPWEGPTTTSRGTPIKRFLLNDRNCFFVITGRHCEYFPLGKQCKFCNFNTSQGDGRAVGLNRPVMENVDDVVEAVKIRSEQVRLIEGRTDMGGFMNSEAETKVYCGWMERAFAALKHKPHMHAHSEAASRKQLQRLKDSGLDSYTFHMEVGDPKYFPEICPGKAEHAPYEGWIEAMSDALEVFGEGKVSVRLIAGLTLIPENGHKTWQEARDAHIEFALSMIKMGVLPVTGPLAMPPGSVWGADPALQKRLPPMDYIYDLALAQDKAMMETGMYDTIDKFALCGLDCAPVYAYNTELGVLRDYGNYGNWMADVVPEELNWLLQFLKEIGVPASPGGGKYLAGTTAPMPDTKLGSSSNLGSFRRSNTV